MVIDRKIPTLWRTAEMLSQKNFSSTGHLSLFLLHQWSATWDTESIAAKYSVMGWNRRRQSELKKTTDAAPLCSWWMAGVALQVAVWSPRLLTSLCQSCSHLRFFTLVTLPSLLLLWVVLLLLQNLLFQQLSVPLRSQTAWQADGWHPGAWPGGH